MLSRPPLSDSYELVSPHDGAVDSSIEDFENKFRIAAERLEWAPLLREGEAPTKFVCRALDPLPLRYWSDNDDFHVMHTFPPEGDDKEGKTARIPNQLGYAVMLLLSVYEVKNWPGLPEIKRKKNRDFPNLGMMADEALLAALDNEDMEGGRSRGESTLVLGQMCWQRNLTRPKR